MSFIWIWVAALAVGMGWWVRQDVAAYRRFAALEDTGSRQAFYRRWIWQSFAIMGGASLVSLWLAGGLDPFASFPAPFAAARLALHGPRPSSSGESMLGFAIGIGAGLGLLLLVQWLRLRRALAPVAGPADALLPRNAREAGLCLLLSANAGFVEELFFRLALPLLLFRLTGSLAAAFLLAGIGFGLAHAYQGWKGIAGTMLVGALLTLSYLGSGSLLRVMAIHALIDVVALLIRPALANLARSMRTGRPPAERPAHGFD